MHACQVCASLALQEALRTLFSPGSDHQVVQRLSRVTGPLAVHVVIGAQFHNNFVVLVAEANPIHVGAIVVPHLAQLQPHRHLPEHKFPLMAYLLSL